ncbi:acyltransferase [Mesorhizobium sp. M0664]|uniref:acyltransferase n=1 Tax=Mesorhizobium sp. M0664 TaxID=2956982 RepID=UPI00333A7263
MRFAPYFVARLAGVQAGAGSKLSYRTVRSARRGNHVIGEESIIHCVFSFDRPDAQITVGKRCFIGRSHLVSAGRIEIGDDVIMSWGITVVDHNSHSVDWRLRGDDVKKWHRGEKDWTGIPIAPVKIENRVWIGFNATILKGVTLGEGSVVGAGAVVTKDVAPFAVVAGNPAKPIRQRLI